MVSHLVHRLIIIRKDYTAIIIIIIISIMVAAMQPDIIIMVVRLLWLAAVSELVSVAQHYKLSTKRIQFGIMVML